MSKYLKKKKRSIQIEKTAFYIVVIVIAVYFTALSQQVKYENQIKEINANHEAEMAALRMELRDDYEFQIAELERYYEYGGDVSQIEREAEYIAKVIYGTARNHADSDKRAVVWCILN